MPQSYIAFSKIERYGGKIADPFETNLAGKEEIESRVFTSAIDKGRRDEAIKLIEASFENSQKIKVGMKKAGKPGVIAKKVFSVLPHFPALTQRVL